MDPVTMALMATAKFGLDAYGKHKQRKALEEQKKLTPEEASYKKKLTELSTKGDPNINKIRNRRISAIREVGSSTQQNITGDLIRSGMENSVVASELRRKAGADVMRQVAEESQKIAERNRQFKQQYSDKLDKFNMDRSQYLKQLSAKQDAIPTLGETAVSHAIDYGAGQVATKQKNWESLINSGDLNETQLNEMMDMMNQPNLFEQAVQSLKNLKPGSTQEWLNQIKEAMERLKGSN